MRGFKFLTPDGCTYYEGEQFVYNLPNQGEKWAVTMHPEPSDVADGRDCGAGGLHMMRTLSSVFARSSWWVWYAKPIGMVLGESEQKLRAQGIALRRISPETLHRALRLGWGTGANLRYANLAGANLRYANLTHANLAGANLADANLRYANLRYAKLRYANLDGTNLAHANLTHANLAHVNLTHANLAHANLPWYYKEQVHND